MACFNFTQFTLKSRFCPSVLYVYEYFMHVNNADQDWTSNISGQHQGLEDVFGARPRSTIQRQGLLTIFFYHSREEIIR